MRLSIFFDDREKNPLTYLNATSQNYEYEKNVIHDRWRIGTFTGFSITFVQLPASDDKLKLRDCSPVQPDSMYQGKNL